MKPAALAAVATGVALAGCATSGTAAEEGYYRCRIERAAGPGTLAMIIVVEQDGRRQFHDFSWASLSQRNRAQLRVEWTHGLPLTPSDDMTVTVTLRRTWRASRFVRVELSRSEVAPRSGDNPITGPGYGQQFHSATVTAPLSRLRAFLAGAPAMTVGVVDVNGRLLAQDRIESANFDMAAREIIAAQPEIEAMAADYRNRCELITEPDDILLT
jgi:hypothetical protein